MDGRRVLVGLDVLAALVVAATFAQLGPPELLFHVVFLVLIVEAFAYGRRICFQRLADASVVLIVYSQLPNLGFRVDALELTEWPLMFGIAILVAWMADREQSAIRRYAGLYRRARERLITAEEAERRRLARDIHDGVGQTLTAASLTLDALADARDEDEAARRIARARALIVTALAETRAAAERIRPPRLAERGLASALHELATRCGAPVLADLDPAAGAALGPDRILEVFRIVQEALGNAVRHGGANIRLVLAMEARGLLVEVSDDGPGFDPARIDPRRLGLTGMRERAAAIGARLRIETAPGGGTLVRMHVHVPETGSTAAPKPVPEVRST
jgi:signal transduction histidine kinase